MNILKFAEKVGKADMSLQELRFRLDIEMYKMSDEGREALTASLKRIEKRRGEELKTELLSSSNDNCGIDFTSLETLIANL